VRARDAEMPLPPEYNSTLCSLSGPSALGLRNCARTVNRAYGTRYRLQQTAAYGFTGKVSTRLSGSKISYSFSHVSVSQSVNTTLLPTEHMVHIYRMGGSSMYVQKSISRVCSRMQV
jgi:hypothetical protein